ncbi:MAG: T9SS type A sorting domain-containing protein [Chitinophagales bacterium]|nr:T9SS type A sorting domain-containing protein [Chitinophagales bacterium]
MKKIIFILVCMLNFKYNYAQLATCKQICQTLGFPNCNDIQDNWEISISHLYIDKQEDPTTVSNNGDEPYLIHIGFRCKLGEKFTANTYAMDALPQNYGTFKTNEIAYTLPKSMEFMQFQNLSTPTVFNIAGILNKITNEGLTFYGSVVVAIEDDGTALNLKKDLVRNIQQALQLTLEEVVETGGQITNQTELTNKLVNIMTQFDFKFGQKFAEIVRFAVGRDDDIIGVHTFLLVDLPNDIFNLLGISVNNFQTAINTYELGYYLLGQVPDLKDMKLIRYLGASAITAVVPPFSLGITFGGTGPRSNTSNPTKNFNFTQYTSVPTASNPTGTIKGKYSLALQSSYYTQDACSYYGDGTQDDKSQVATNCGYSMDCSTSLWLQNFGKNQGWESYDKYPRFFADINNDGRKDIIGCGAAGVLASLNLGNNTFGSPYFVITNDFCFNKGWNSQNTFPRFVVDINKDNKPDIVGFGSYGVRVYLGNGSGGFNLASSYTYGGFGNANQNGGYISQSIHPRYLEDVDGDGDLDIIGFGQNYVLVAKNTGSSFVATPNNWTSQFCPNTGWTNNDVYPRYVTDINGDNKADIIGFSQTGTSVSLSTGTSFQTTATTWQSGFGFNQGYTSNNNFPRFLADFNGDGRKDIIGFANDKTVVALNNSLNGQNNFGQAVTWSRNFGKTDRATQYGYDNYWDDFNTRPRLIGDINGDGKADIVGFGASGVLIALSNGKEFSCQRWINPGFDAVNGFTNQNDFPRFVENISNSDSRSEIAGFGATGVFVLNCNSGSVLRTSKNTNEIKVDEKQELELSDIKIVPNPSNGIIDVTLSNPNINTNIYIYNTTGQLIKQVNNVIGSTIIDLSENINGFYFLRFVNANNENIIDTKKIIIHKN